MVLSTNPCRPAAAAQRLGDEAGARGMDPLDSAGAAVKAQLDPLWFAMLQFRERKFEECAERCTARCSRATGATRPRCSSSAAR